MSQENNFIPNQKDYRELRPFPLFMKHNFPFIENTYESLDIYGLLCEVVKFLNNVIANENIVTENQQAVYNAFVELNNYVSHYFDNLDVQEEINNKLDDMVESGILQEIIADYLNSKAVFGYDNVESMLNATNLINGSYARTLGFYSKNDGGGALYKIRNITNDDVVNGINLIAMNDSQNQLVAELIVNDLVNVKQHGAKGDNTTDDLSILQAINDLYENRTIFIPNGTYLISNTLFISNNNSLLMDKNAKIKASQHMDYLLVYNKQNITSSYDKTFRKYIKGGTLDGDYKVDISMLSVQGILGFNISDITILNFNKYGIKTKYQDNSDVNECFFNNIYIRNDQPIIDTIGIYNQANDCRFSNIVIRDVHKAILTTTTILNHIHGWNAMPALIPDSYFLKTINNDVLCNEVYADTYQYSFISTWQSLNITNAFIFNNKNNYTPEMQTKYKPILFKSEQDPFNLNTWGYFKVFNSQINVSNFDHVDLTNRYDRNNNFSEYNNYYSNIDHVDNKNYFNSSETGSGSNKDVDLIFTPGVYGMNNNDNLPGTFKYGVLTVETITSSKGAYITDDFTNYRTYCKQTFLSSEPVVKLYVRIYASGSWTSWQKVTTTTV